MTEEISNETLSTADNSGPTKADTNLATQNHKSYRSAVIWTTSTFAIGIITAFSTGVMNSAWDGLSSFTNNFRRNSQLETTNHNLFKENNDLSDRIKELEETLEKSEKSVTAYIPLHLVKADDCYKLIRSWAKENEYRQSDFENTRRMFRISMIEEKASLRCAGANYSDTSFILISSNDNYSDFVGNIFKDMKDEFYHYISTEGITKTNGRPWSFDGPYAEGILVPMETNYETYKHWIEYFDLPEKFTKDLEYGVAKKACYQVAAEHFCNFRYPKGSITVLMSSLSEPKSTENSGAVGGQFRDDEMVRYEFNAIISAMNYGKYDIFSDQRYYTGNDLKNILKESSFVPDNADIITIFRNWD